jgi:hypothetical protein
MPQWVEDQMLLNGLHNAVDISNQLNQKAIIENYV